jgi:uncharacterized protein YegP (UPF0339 family)
MSNEPARFVPTFELAQYDIVNKKGDDMGKVQTFVVDMRAGLIAFALVSFGGFLGIGDKWFAVPWAALDWHPETLKEAPGMDKYKWLEEINKWQEEEDLKLLDRYYTSLGYESYTVIFQEVITKRERRKVDAKFEINKDVAGKFRFKLVAVNGETIAESQAYTTKDNAMIGIRSVKKNAAEAVIEDKTV